MPCLYEKPNGWKLQLPLTDSIRCFCISLSSFRFSASPVFRILFFPETRHALSLQKTHRLEITTAFDCFCSLFLFPHFFLYSVFGIRYPHQAAVSYFLLLYNLL